MGAGHSKLWPTYAFAMFFVQKVKNEETARRQAQNLALHVFYAHGGKILTSTFINDAAKIWNNAPECIKLSKTVYSAKKNIKMYTATLPI